MTEPPHVLTTPAEYHFTIGQTAAVTLGHQLEGNGLEAQQVSLTRHDTLVHQIPCSITVKLKPEIIKSELKGKQPHGQVLASKTAVVAHGESDALVFLKERDIQQEIFQTTGKIPGQGFGMDPLTFTLHAAKKEFSCIDMCLKCNGATSIPCMPCNATGNIPCMSCNGLGFSSCQYCFGAGQIRQNDGNMAPCTRCQTGRIQCLSCRGLKTLVCPTCQGLCKTGCTECAQSGFLTHIYQIVYKAECLFEADLREIPPEVQKIIETLGIKELATKGHAEIIRQEPEVREKHIFIPFTALLPVAQAEFSIGGNPYPAVVVGLQGHILQIDCVMDTLVKPGIHALQKLSKEPLASQALIDTACKYRFIREVMSGLAHRSKKAVHQKLLQDYPLILSAKYANATVHHADTALNLIGACRRHIGLAVGTFISALMAAAYYITPVRSRILDVMQEKEISLFIPLVDIALWILTWVIAVFTIRLITTKAFEKRLPDILQTGEAGLSPAGRHALWALPATFGACFLAAAFSAAKPAWMVLVLKMLGI